MREVKRTIHMEAVLAKQKARRSIPQMEKHHNLNKVLGDTLVYYHRRERATLKERVQNSFPK